MKSNLNMFLGVGLLSVLVGCASKPTPVKISATSNAAEEITTQARMIEAGYKNQIDVLAPGKFADARKHFSEAKKLNQRGASTDEVFTSLGYSKAYLNHAISEASFAARQVEEVTKAREQALAVGARSFPDQLNPLDHDLSEMSDMAASKIKNEQKVALQSKYIALELFCIKHNKLGGVRKLIKQAEEKNAAKITPKAWSEAVSKFNIADKLIETDRHSNMPIATAVNTATISATRVLNLLASEQKTRGQTPEQRAVALETKDNAVKTANSETFAVKADSLQKDQELAEQDQVLAEQDQVLAEQDQALVEQGQELAAQDQALAEQDKVIVAQVESQSVTEDENTVLRKKEADEKMVSVAAAKFSPTEAEVYRQDGVLIIRLKSMNFASGRADLPSDSMNVLAKVKSIIKELGTGDVMVEGHTDSIGPAKTNQALSKKRAESVMKYFASGAEMQNNKLASAGFGYSKPLATNKTKEGRAQNRRVDVRINTNQTL